MPVLAGSFGCPLATPPMRVSRRLLPTVPCLSVDTRGDLAAQVSASPPHSLAMLGDERSLSGPSLWPPSSDAFDGPRLPQSGTGAANLGPRTTSRATPVTTSPRTNPSQHSPSDLTNPARTRPRMSSPPTRTRYSATASPKATPRRPQLATTDDVSDRTRSTRCPVDSLLGTSVPLATRAQGDRTCLVSAALRTFPSYPHRFGPCLALPRATNEPWPIHAPAPPARPTFLGQAYSICTDLDRTGCLRATTLAPPRPGGTIARLARFAALDFPRSPIPTDRTPTDANVTAVSAARQPRPSAHSPWTTCPGILAHARRLAYLWPLDPGPLTSHEGRRHSRPSHAIARPPRPSLARTRRQVSPSQALPTLGTPSDGSLEGALADPSPTADDKGSLAFRSPGGPGSAAATSPARLPLASAHPPRRLPHSTAPRPCFDRAVLATVQALTTHVRQRPYLGTPLLEQVLPEPSRTTCPRAACYPAASLATLTRLTCPRDPSTYLVSTGRRGASRLRSQALAIPAAPALGIRLHVLRSRSRHHPAPESIVPRATGEPSPILAWAGLRLVERHASAFRGRVRQSMARRRSRLPAPSDARAWRGYRQPTTLQTAPPLTCSVQLQASRLPSRLRLHPTDALPSDSRSLDVASAATVDCPFLEEPVQALRWPSDVVSPDLACLLLMTCATRPRLRRPPCHRQLSPSRRPLEQLDPPGLTSSSRPSLIPLVSPNPVCTLDCPGFARTPLVERTAASPCRLPLLPWRKTSLPTSFFVSGSAGRVTLFGSADDPRQARLWAALCEARDVMTGRRASSSSSRPSHLDSAHLNCRSRAIPRPPRARRHAARALPEPSRPCRLPARSPTGAADLPPGHPTPRSQPTDASRGPADSPTTAKPDPARTCLPTPLANALLPTSTQAYRERLANRASCQLQPARVQAVRRALRSQLPARHVRAGGFDRSPHARRVRLRTNRPTGLWSTWLRRAYLPSRLALSSANRALLAQAPTTNEGYPDQPRPGPDRPSRLPTSCRPPRMRPRTAWRDRLPSTVEPNALGARPLRVDVATDTTSERPPSTRGCQTSHPIPGSSRAARPPRPARGDLTWTSQAWSTPR